MLQNTILVHPFYSERWIKVLERVSKNDGREIKNRDEKKRSDKNDLPVNNLGE